MSYADVTLSDSGDKLSAVSIKGDFHLFTAESDNPSELKELAQSRDGIAFTPDNRIVYATDTSGNEEIWIMNLDGSDQRQLTNDKNLDAYPYISPNNRYIYFASNRTGQTQLWRMNLDGSEQTQITKTNGGYPMFATFDGKKVYYQKAITGGIWELSVDSGEEIEIIAKKTFRACAFAPDGNNLAFVSKNDENNTFRIDVMDLATKNIIKTFLPIDEKQRPFRLNWLSNENAFSYVIDNNSAKDSLWIQNLAEDKPKLFANIGSEQIMDCKFSPDRKAVAFIRRNWKHDSVLLTGLK